MEDDVIDISDEDLEFIQMVLDENVDLYRAYERALSYLQEGSDSYFWFQNAALINRQANGQTLPGNLDSAPTFIIQYTRYGLLIDGQSNNPTDTSNAIATAVILDLIAAGGIPSLDVMLVNDISRAIDAGGQTPGGWGGAFYYWDTVWTFDDVTGAPITVGESVLASPAEYEKFLHSVTFGTLAVLAQEIEGGAGNFEILNILNGVWDAPLPFSIKEEIFLNVSRAFFTLEIVNPNKIGDFKYNEATGDWIGPYGLIVNPDIPLYDELNERREIRLSLEANNFDEISSIVAALEMSFNSDFNQQCFSAGTLVSMADGSFKPIETISALDSVLSYDEDGALVASQVKKTFKNTVGCLLDFHGLFVTPGHVTYCASGEKAGEHIPILDILMSDSAVMTQTGELMRASTGELVGSKLDKFITVIFSKTQNDAANDKRELTKMRLGTKFTLPSGEERNLFEILEAADFGYDEETELVEYPDGKHGPLRYLGSPPRPEDYVLSRSGLTLTDIYRAGETREGGLIDLGRFAAAASLRSQ